MIIIPHNHHGHMSTDNLISMYIAFLLIPVAIFLTRSLIWVFKKRNTISFYKYTIYDDDYNVIPNFNTIFFIMINSLAAFFALVGIVIEFRK